jgi:hypothetical protein
MTGENCDADVRDALRGTLERLAPGAAENGIEVVPPCVFFLFSRAQLRTGFNQWGNVPGRDLWYRIAAPVELARYRYQIPIRSVYAGAAEHLGVAQIVDGHNWLPNAIEDVDSLQRR